MADESGATASASLAEQLHFAELALQGNPFDFEAHTSRVQCLRGLGRGLAAVRDAREDFSSRLPLTAGAWRFLCRRFLLSRGSASLRGREDKGHSTSHAGSYSLVNCGPRVHCLR